VFKSPAQYLFDLVTEAFGIQGFFQSRKIIKYDAEPNLFTGQEIEAILDMKKLKIPTFFVLSDVNSLKETSLNEFYESASRKD
jgi:hypothetical protein